MSARVKQEDLAALLDVLEGREPLDQMPAELVGKLTDWVATAIRVREAQRTKSKTTHHEQLMEAWQAAVARWEELCEEVAIGYKTDIADYTQTHPKPRFADFLRAYRRQSPTDVCPMCGSPLDPDPEDLT